MSLPPLTKPPNRDQSRSARERAVYRADRNVAKDLPIGGLMYFLAAVILLAMAPKDGHPWCQPLACLNVAVSALCLGLRVLAMRNFEPIHGHSATRWQWLVALGTVPALMTLALVVGYTHISSPGDFSVVVATLISAGISIGIVSVFAHMLVFCILCLFLLSAPHLIGLALTGGLPSHMHLLGAVAIFSIYLITLAFNRYREIWAQIGHTIDLEHISRELQASREEALAASAAKSEFIANTSHELRTPLQSILGNAELIVLGKRADRQQDYARAIVRAGKSLLHLLNELIDLSRIESGGLKIQIDSVGLRSLVHDIESEMRPTAAEKGLTLDFVVDEDAPEWISVDSARLRQVIVNLLSNAIKFTDSGRVSLSMNYQTDEQSLEVFISDTGPGIPEGQRENIFDAFVQLDGNSRRSNAGVGLGLAICRRLVEALGGRIGVDSGEGIGSTFWFILPAAVVDAPYQISSSSIATALRSEDGVRVLVVDDNASNLQIVSDQLATLGHACETADGGEAALARLMRESTADDKITLILLDCQMPGMDGYQTVRQIRRLDGDVSNVPVVALTANAMPEERLKCHLAGMNDYITKPISISQLESLVERWAGRDGSQAFAPGEPEDPSLPESPAQPRDIQSLDGRRIGELRAMSAQIGMDGLQTAFNAFRSDMAARLNDLSRLTEAGDFARAGRAAHAARGMCLDFGAQGLASCFETIDQAADNHELTPALLQGQGLEEATQRVCRAIAAELELQLKSPP